MLAAVRARSANCSYAPGARPARNVLRRQPSVPPLPRSRSTTYPPAARDVDRARARRRRRAAGGRRPPCRALARTSPRLGTMGRGARGLRALPGAGAARPSSGTTSTRSCSSVWRGTTTPSPALQRALAVEPAYLPGPTAPRRGALRSRLARREPPRLRVAVEASQRVEPRPLSSGSAASTPPTAATTRRSRTSSAPSRCSRSSAPPTTRWRMSLSRARTHERGPARAGTARDVRRALAGGRRSAFATRSPSCATTPRAMLQRGVSLRRPATSPGRLPRTRPRLRRIRHSRRRTRTSSRSTGRAADWPKAEAHYRIAVGAAAPDARRRALRLRRAARPAGEVGRGGRGAIGCAIAVNPAHAQAHNNLGQILERQRQFAAAADEYRRGRRQRSRRSAWRASISAAC